MRSAIEARPLAHIAGVLILVASATILAALAFEHMGGFAPCPLCLQQRWAYYGGIPLALVALLLARAGRGPAARAVLGLFALVFLFNAGLGVYHAGVEWQLWPGPASCGTVQEIATGNLMEALKTTRVVACDQAPWRFLGLSFAGWNAVVSAGLAVLAGLAALRAKA